MLKNSKYTILIVDDAPENLTVLTELLLPNYRVLAANSGEACLRIAASEPVPDLILLDVMMPVMDGYAVLAQLRENPVTSEIPVIFLTALDDAVSEERGLQLGAADYVAKPIRPTVLLARVRSQLEAKQTRDWLKDKNAALEAEVSRRMAENNLIQQASVRALAYLAETRDPETGNHLLRTQAYMHRLALELKNHPRFATTLKEPYITDLVRSAPLHDIGKVGVPDSILLKPGPLSDEEWVIMKRHSKLGSDAIQLAEWNTDTPVEFLSIAREIAHWHHEKWDGTGYPDGLMGDATPISARMMALADVFDALTSVRPYKQAISCEAAREIISEDRGKHFDPDIVEAFHQCFEDYKEIAVRYQNG